MQGLQHAGNTGCWPTMHANRPASSSRHLRSSGSAACSSMNQGRASGHTTNAPSNGHHATVFRKGRSPSSLDAAMPSTADTPLSCKDLHGMLEDQLAIGSSSMQHQLTNDELDMHYSLADGHDKVHRQVELAPQAFTSAPAAGGASHSHPRRHHASKTHVALWPTSNGNQQSHQHHNTASTQQGDSPQGTCTGTQTHSQRVHRRQGSPGGYRRMRAAQDPESAAAQGPQQVPQHVDSTHHIDPRLLTKRLSMCRSFSELQELCDLHINSFNHFHVACALNRMAKCPKPSQQEHAFKQLHRDLEMLFVHNLPQYTAREVANTVWGWSRSGHVPSDSTRQLIIASITARDGWLLHGPQVAPQALANLACGLANLQWQDKALWAHLTSAALAALERHQKQSHSTRNPGNRDSGPSRQWQRSGDWSSSQGSRQWGQEGRQSQAGRFAPVDIAGLAWAYATARQHHTRLFDTLVEVALADLYEFCAADLVQMLWACATTRHASPRLFQAAAPMVLECIEGFTAQGLANTAWAYAVSGVHDSQVLAAICRHAMLQAQYLQPMHYAQLTWALTKTHQVQPHIMRAALASAVAQPQVWRTKDLSLLLYSLTTAGLMDADAFQHLSPVLLERLQAAQQAGVSARSTGARPQARHATQGLLFQDMSQITWAYATGGVYDNELFSTMVQLCLANKDAWLGVPKAFQSMVWSLGYAGHYDARIFETVAQHLSVSLSPTTKLSPSEVAGVMVALAAMQHHHPAVCTAAARHFTWLCEHQEHNLNSDTITSMMWSLAVLDHTDEAFLASALSTLAARWEEQSRMMQAARQQQGRQGGRGRQQSGAGSAGHSDDEDDELQLTGWGPTDHMAGVQSAGDGDDGAEWDEEEGVPAHTLLRKKQLGQLFHVVMWLQDHSSPAVADLPRQLLPPALLDRAEEVWQQQTCKGRQVSSFQADVFKLLRGVGLKVQLEQLTNDKAFSLDCIVSIAGQKVAVEANGPVHYDKSQPPRLLGNKVLRDRLLAGRGYAVLNVAYWEWESMNEDREMQQAMLLHKLMGLLGEAGKQELERLRAEHNTDCFSDVQCQLR